jgi:hypothetical protein
MRTATDRSLPSIDRERRADTNMTYKQMLIHRYHDARRDDSPNEPLDYMALRNLDARRAWQRRRLEQADQTPRRHQSAWMPTSRRAGIFMPAFWSHHAT